MSVEIITNHVPRFIEYGYELSDSERADFDYFDWSTDGDGWYRGFVRYRGELYDLLDTEGTFPADRRWSYVSHSFFSGVVFMYPENPDRPGEIDLERVICGRYYVS